MELLKVFLWFGPPKLKFLAPPLSLQITTTSCRGNEQYGKKGFITCLILFSYNRTWNVKRIKDKQYPSFTTTCIERHISGLWPKKLDFQKYFKKPTSLWFHFNNYTWIDMIMEMCELISKQENSWTKDHGSSLQSPQQKWHRHFLIIVGKLSSQGQYSGLWEGKQTIFRLDEGQKKIIKW